MGGRIQVVLILLVIRTSNIMMWSRTSQLILIDFLVPEIEVLIAMTLYLTVRATSIEMKTVQIDDIAGITLSLRLKIHSNTLCYGWWDILWFIKRLTAFKEQTSTIHD
jgi:hypothetical protein